ncbi:MAG TPA: alkaline phosphatase family protein [Actinomycetota bacterium]
MRSSSARILVLLTLACGVAALVVSFESGLVAALATGVLVLAAVLVVARTRPETEGPPNPGRRRFLGVMGLAGFGLIAGGAGAGRTVRRMVRPDPRPALDAMARDLGAEALELVRRAYHPDRSGDLQLLLTPGSTSNYAQESVALLPRDPRSSHAMVWNYLERVPITVYAPGLVEPSDSTDRVTLADLAPTAAHLMGFDDFRPADGAPLPGVPRPATPPKVIVTFVIDGGGWNVLHQWPTAWPNLQRLMRAGATYRNAIVGSFPAVTACAHATIGTGAFPRTHGITGHNVRNGRRPVKAYGEPGKADPSFILVPTLADRWTEHTQGAAWVGEIGYQVWHLGMLGRGGRPLGDKPVAVYWDERKTGSWQPQNPERYRMPKQVPPLSTLEQHQSDYADPGIDDRYERFAPGLRAVCCSPPIIRYQGDLIEATLESEEVGRHDATDLLFVNYKSPDYTGHVYNMLSLRERFALRATDEQLGRLADFLEASFAPGEFALIVCADHGQCPTVETMGGVRVDPIQLQDDLDREFGDSVFKIVTSVAPSEIYLNHKALWDSGVSRDDLAAFLRDYRYRDNIGPYVKKDAVDWGRLDERPFAAVLSTDFMATLAGADLSRYGDGIYTSDLVDPGIPPVTW